MTNEDQSSKAKMYDLKERTSKFSENIIDFVNLLPSRSIYLTLIGQMMRSATSIGANYCEADGAESKKDFIHKIAICKKESKETMYWLRMITRAYPDRKEICYKLWKEAHEFSLIFSAIFNKSKGK